MGDLYAGIKLWKPQILVVDESHKCKNPQSKRTKKTKALADIARHTYILSGTPVLNTPMDLFSQMSIMDKTFWYPFNNFYGFRAHYFYDKNAGMPRDRYFPNWVERPDTIDRISKKLAACTMSVKKKDCLDLPPLVRKKIEVPMHRKQAQIYREMKRDFIAYIEDQACVASLAITKALRLQQIVSGYVAVETMDGRKQIRLKDNPRAVALTGLLEEITTHSKVIVWAVFKENYQIIREVCDDLGVKYVELHGEVTQKKREEAVEAFNNSSDISVCIGHPGSGGIGINLTSASYSIFYSRGFSLEHDLQAEARNHRGGSEIHDKITRIDLVCPGTIDELILDKLASKQAINEKIVKEIAAKL